MRDCTGSTGHNAGSMGSTQTRSLMESLVHVIIAEPREAAAGPSPQEGVCMAFRASERRLRVGRELGLWACPLPALCTSSPPSLLPPPPGSCH